MGRRSINTTKSGKYMNPTDQARKEARKKELKKNKRQRQMVRAAVLKMKDPSQILEELQKIDEMEYNVLQPSPLNEKVLREKRKKLRETFDRVLKMYDKDEPEKWVELKRQETDYEKKKTYLISYYESVKHAQSVQLEDIPLPEFQVPSNILYGGMPSQIPMPSEPGNPNIPKPILKKDTVYKERPAGLEPPGVPPGPPPDFADLLTEVVKPQPSKKLRFSGAVPEDKAPTEDLVAAPAPAAPQPVISTPTNPTIADVFEESMEVDADGVAAAKPTSLQQRMLALSGQNIDEFMKEMEEVHKKRERDRAADLNARLTALKHRDGRDSESDSDGEGAPPTAVAPPLGALEPPGTAPLVPLPPPGLRPPPLRAGLGPPPLRMPGMPMGPPPGMGLMPPGPPPGPPPRLLRPPGPPPGAPPRLLLRPPGPPPSLPAHSAPPPHLHAPHHPPPLSVLSAAPQLIQKKEGQTGATITAKPQIRNLSADVTRFVPSALRVKREDKRAKAPMKNLVQRSAELPKQAPTKDDAYMQFMKEMEGLL